MCVYIFNINKQSTKQLQQTEKKHLVKKKYFWKSLIPKLDYFPHRNKNESI